MIRERNFRPIYETKGRMQSLGRYAVNIYTGCTGRCSCCTAYQTLRKSAAEFFGNVAPRRDIVDAVREQLLMWGHEGEHITLCTLCDPYPRGCDTGEPGVLQRASSACDSRRTRSVLSRASSACDSGVTREIIRYIKASGNHVRILTKNPTDRDFDLLDENDWFGVTLVGNDMQAAVVEPNAMAPSERVEVLEKAKAEGISTWINLDPVLDMRFAMGVIKRLDADLYRVGKVQTSAVSSVKIARSFYRRLEEYGEKKGKNIAMAGLWDEVCEMILGGTLLD